MVFSFATWLALAWAVPSHATEEPMEEIIVHGDDHARWDHTRWLVTSELILPVPLSLGADTNQSFASYAMQTTLVLHCEQDGRLSRRRMEVLCEVEDIGLAATSLHYARGPRQQAIAQAVLDEIDAKLTGAHVQLQATSRGGVHQLDIEGVVARNARERLLTENLRLLLLQIVAGFHLETPPSARRTGPWIEHDSPLLSLPSLTASTGSTSLVHSISPYGDYQLVQTIGEGTTVTRLPNFEVDTPSFDRLSVDLGSADLRPTDLPLAKDTESRQGLPSAQPRDAIADMGAAAEDSPDLQAPTLGRDAGRESDVELIYAFRHTGVALFDRDTGIMTERVWQTHGAPTASSAGGTIHSAYRNVGHLRQLDEHEQPDVGPTRQISLPGHEVEGLSPWADLEVAPGG